MNHHEQYAPSSTSALHLQLWSAHVDALERHLSANTWALAAFAVVLIAYPLARIVLSGLLRDIVIHGVVPDVVRTVLRLI